MQKMQKLFNVFLICVLATATLMVSGCTDKNVVTDDKTVEINGTVWQWTELIGDKTSGLTKIPNPGKYTLEFLDDGTYSIKADCNMVGGKYMVNGTKLTIEPGFSTMAYCGPDSLDGQYLALIYNVTGFTIKDNKLMLTFDEKGKQMVFVTDDDLIAEEIIDDDGWKWIGVVENKNNAFVQTAVPDAEKYFVIFNADKTYFIKADCNTGNGKYTLEGDKLSLSAPALTKVACGPDSMDAQYLSMLNNVTSVTMDGEILVLNVGSNGDKMLFAQGETISAKDLTDGEWKWAGSVENKGGSYVRTQVPVPENYVIGFKSDKTYFIKADCNVGNGKYTLDDVKDTSMVLDLSIEAGALTQAYCGPDSMDKQYLSMLRNVTAFSMMDDQLVLHLGNDARMYFTKGVTVSEKDLTANGWKWVGMVEADPATTSFPWSQYSPESYLLEFKSDKTYFIKADCNTGNGKYNLAESKGQTMILDLSMENAALTKAYCGPDSMDVQYLSMLKNVTAFSMDDERLYLHLGKTGAKMIFDKAEITGQ